MGLLDDVQHTYEAAGSAKGRRCMVAPAPDLAKRLRAALRAVRENAPDAVAAKLVVDTQDRVGFNDGLNRPGTDMPFGAPSLVVRDRLLEKARLQGDIRLFVMLVDFDDRPFANPGKTRERLETLFFSEGEIPTGSVREYFTEATGKRVAMTGQIVGPYRAPRPIAYYANGASGTGAAEPNCRTLARDVAQLAQADHDLGPYDNDGDGYVEAFIIVHAGQGAEQTGARDDIWSHKWVLSGDPQQVGGAKVYAYLTVPEDARLGVCAHELGHLVFGFPDLYDTSDETEGVGNWCLMGGGSWLDDGHRPAHPSAWCKCKQGWAVEDAIAANGPDQLADVKRSERVIRLWRNGKGGKEYFLAETRFRTGFDDHLPGEGLLIWHVDDSQANNANPDQPRVALLQADGQFHLERRKNRGDDGDPWPGSMGKTSWDALSSPNSNTRAGQDSLVAITDIQLAQDAVRAYFRVSKT